MHTYWELTGTCFMRACEDFIVCSIVYYILPAAKASRTVFQIEEVKAYTLGYIAFCVHSRKQIQNKFKVLILYILYYCVQHWFFIKSGS